MERKLDANDMSAIYTMLVKVCGAREEDRDQFMYNQMEKHHPTEWRFCGNLGFGGKFWRNAGRLYVSCYREDETDDMRATIKKANEWLDVFGNLNGDK